MESAPPDVASFAMSMVAVLATTVVGALGVSTIGPMSPKSLAIASLVSGGMMSGCALVVVLDAVKDHSNLGFTALGIFLGALVMRLLEFIPTDGLVFDQVKGQRARKVLLLFWSVLIHSLGEGLCLGSSAAASEGTGNMVMSCIALHNIPEGAAIALAFLTRGVSKRMACIMAMVSNATQPLASLPAYWFLAHRTTSPIWMPIGLGFASGCMASIVVTDIVPDALELKAVSRATAAKVFCVAAGGVMGMDVCTHIMAR